MRWSQWPGIGLVVAMLVGCAGAGGAGRPESAPPRAVAAAAPQGEVNAALRAPGASGGAPQALEKITFAVPQVNGVTMPYAIGLQKGFFREEGLEVELPAMRSNLIAAGLASGEVDYISSFSPGVRNALSGMPLRVILGTATRSTRRLMTVPGIQTIEQLRGQTFVIGGIGDGPHSAAMIALEHYGIDPQTEVTWLVVGTTNAERFLTIQQGMAQATVVSGPELAQAEAFGLVTLLRLSEIVPLPESGVTTSLQKLETQREQVKRVVRAVVRSLQYVKADREGSIPFFMERLRLTREEAEQAYDGVAWAFSDDGTVSERGLRVSIEAEKRHLRLTEDVPFARVADFGPLYEVLAEMGITPAEGSAR